MDFLPDTLDYKLKVFIYGLLIFHAVVMTVWIVLAFRSNDQAANIDKAIQNLAANEEMNKKKKK